MSMAQMKVAAKDPGAGDIFFDWGTAGMTDAEMETFVWYFAKLGDCWQFFTLAGFHCG